jgi:hypothetical protein
MGKGVERLPAQEKDPSYLQLGSFYLHGEVLTALEDLSPTYPEAIKEVLQWISGNWVLGRIYTETELRKTRFVSQLARRANEIIEILGPHRPKEAGWPEAWEWHNWHLWQADYQIEETNLPHLLGRLRSAIAFQFWQTGVVSALPRFLANRAGIKQRTAEFAGRAVTGELVKISQGLPNLYRVYLSLIKELGAVYVGTLDRLDQPTELAVVLPYRAQNKKARAAFFPLRRPEEGGLKFGWTFPIDSCRVSSQFETAFPLPEKEERIVVEGASSN